jgi:histidinol-phosphate phosphatase family protein
MIVEEVKKAVFLDRDGCISPDNFGLKPDPEKYHLYPYTIEALRILQNLGYMLIIVTNQAGIAKGYFDLETLEKVHAKLRELLNNEGIILTDIYYSPYLETGTVPPFNIAHEDRKPGLGMFYKAKRDHPFDPNKSWMLGDRKSDVYFGKKAGLKTVLLLSGHGKEELLTGFEGWEYKPDFIAENLLTAAKLIQMLTK